MPCADETRNMSAAELRDYDNAGFNAVCRQRGELKTRNDVLAAELCVLRRNCIRYFNGIFGGIQEPEWMIPLRQQQGKHRDVDKARAVQAQVYKLAGLKGAKSQLDKMGVPNATLDADIIAATQILGLLQGSDPMTTKLY